MLLDFTIACMLLSGTRVRPWQFMCTAVSLFARLTAPTGRSHGQVALVPNACCTTDKRPRALTQSPYNSMTFYYAVSPAVAVSRPLIQARADHRSALHTFHVCTLVLALS